VGVRGGVDKRVGTKRREGGGEEGVGERDRREKWVVAS